MLKSKGGSTVVLTAPWLFYDVEMLDGVLDIDIPFLGDSIGVISLTIIGMGEDFFMPLVYKLKNY